MHGIQWGLTCYKLEGLSYELVLVRHISENVTYEDLLLELV